MRFLLGLLLGRKRRVKLKGFSMKGGQEWLNVVIRGDEEDEPVSVAVPKLDEEGRNALQADLNRLFGVAAEPAEASAEGDSEGVSGDAAGEELPGAAAEGAPRGRIGVLAARLGSRPRPDGGGARVGICPPFRAPQIGPTFHSPNST